MSHKIPLEGKCLRAVGTAVGASSHVGGLVLAQAAPRLETLFAGGTAVGSLVPVYLGVAAQARAVHKTLLADGANVWPTKKVKNVVKIKYLICTMYMEGPSCQYTFRKFD
jgi:hypothetical protein